MTFTLSITASGGCLPPPPNDHCSGALPITDGPHDALADNCPAGADLVEAVCQANSNKDMWYVYTSSCTGSLALNTEGSVQTDTVLSVNDECGGLSLGCDDDAGSGNLSSIPALPVIAGEDYYIRVASFSTGCGSFDLNLTCTPGAQGACCNAGVCSIDYELTCEAGGGTYIGDNTDCDPDPCSTGACCNDSTGACEGVMSENDCLAIGGTTFTAGQDCVNGPFVCPSPGDDCTLPVLVTIPADLTPEYVDTNTTCGRGNDYADTCLGSYDGGEDILYEVTVTEDICLDFSLETNASWTGIAIDDTCPPDATCIAVATSSAASKSILGVELTPGTYTVMIDTWPTPDCIDSLTLTISECAGPPVNDGCTNGLPVTDGTPAVEADNCGATEPDDTEVSCELFANGTSHDVWYEYTATCTGTITMDTENSVQGDTNLAVFDACGGNELACDDDGGTGFLSLVTFDAIAGTVVQVRVSSYSTGCGPFDLNIACDEAPQGACCSNGLCTVQYELVCDAMGDVYGGDNTICAGLDCNSNGADDACEILEDPSLDCNNNDVPDDCDLDDGTSGDCNFNGIPDECEDDCNENGIADECDITAGTSEDCQPDGIPDECQLGARGLDPNGSAHCQLGIPDDTGVGPTGLLATGSDLVSGFSSADNVTLASSLNLARVDWQTVYYGGAADCPGADTVRIQIFASDGNIPTGAPLATYNAVPHTKGLAARPPIFGSNPVYDFSATLAPTFAMSAGVEYWIEIVGDPSTGGCAGIFGWVASPDAPPGDSAYAQDDGTGYVRNPDGAASDLALCLFSGGGGGGADCNSNGVPDECDIADGVSEDCDTNGTPDECEFLDCDSNGVHDPCDVLQGADDCNNDMIPDKCQNEDNDCNGNEIPDDCELPLDPDCNNNDTLDECDISSGDSYDCQPDGIPDECQLGGGAGGDVVADGSFEGGAFGGFWTESSTNFGTPLCDAASCGPGGGTAGPNTGDWWAWFGGIGSFEVGSVEQSVTIPNGTANLAFYLWIGAASANGVDDLVVSLDGNVLLTILENDATYAGGYTLVNIDVTAYADGGAHTLLLESTCLGPGVTNFNVDDVSLVVTAGASNDCNGNGVPDDCDNCADLDGDGDVDNVDYQMFRATYGRMTGNPAYNECADYDGSGAVGLGDYMTWLGCYRDYINNPFAGPPVPGAATSGRPGSMEQTPVHGGQPQGGTRPE
jgi:hypothetical protein